MSLMRIQARLERDGGLPEDDVVNVWHFDGDQSFADDADDTVARLLVFYNAIDQYLAPNLSGVIEFKVYDMEAPIPRVPVYTFTGAITPSASAPLPSEVALCLSFEAEQVSGIDQARRRGRVYIGPLSSSVVDAYEAGDPDVRPDDAFRNALAEAAAELAHGPDAGDARLAVYSPTTDIDSSTADAFNDVVSGWVDDAFDIQRRRGSAATSRITWEPA